MIIQVRGDGDNYLQKIQSLLENDPQTMADILRTFLAASMDDMDAQTVAEWAFTIDEVESLALQNDIDNMLFQTACAQDNNNPKLS